MSSLLLDWLNEEVVLSRQVTSLEVDFANGYLFGELLSKFNQQQNLDSFSDKETTEAKMLNFCLLEPSLAALNIPFNAQIAEKIMRRQEGVTKKLLYQIKMNFDSMGPTRVVIPAQKEVKTGPRKLMNFPAQTRKHEYQEANHRHFEYFIGSLAESDKSIRMERALKRFTEAGEQYERDQKRNKEDVVQYAQWLTQERKRLGKYRLESKKAREKSREDSNLGVHKESLARKASREERERRFGQKLQAEKAQKQEQVRLAERSAMKEEMTAIEQALSQKHNELSPEEREREVANPFIQGEHQTFLDKEYMAAAATDYIQSIKKKRQEGAARREGRRQRRREYLVQNNQEKVSQSMRDRVQIMEAALHQTCSAERQIGERIEKIQKYARVSVLNRENREQQYEARRREDAKEALEKDMAHFDLHFKRYDEDVAAHQETFSRSLETRKAASHSRVQDLCQETVESLLGLAMAAAATREDLDLVPSVGQEKDSEMLPNELWSDLKLNFVKGHKVQVPWTDLSLSCEISDFLCSRGFWAYSFSNEAQELQRYFLGDVIQHVRLCYSPLSPPPPLPRLPRYPLHVALLGSPFSGKRVLAERLATKFGLRVIDTSRLIEDALQSYFESARRGEKESSDEQNTLVGLGKKVHSRLSLGKEIEDSTYIELIVHAIEEGQNAIHLQVEQSSREEAAKDRSLVSDIQRGGWLLCDFPANLDQAKLLQVALTGRGESVVLPSPHSADSVLAPATPSSSSSASEALPGQSGLHLVFNIAPDVMQVLLRALGRRVDSLSGEEYHLAMKPPPMDEPIKFRLRIGEEEKHKRSLLPVKISSHQHCSLPLEAWYNKYNAWLPLSTGSVDSMFLEVDQTIATFLRQRAEERVKKRQKEDEATEKARRQRNILRKQKMELDQRILRLKTDLDEMKNNATAGGKTKDKDKSKQLQADIEAASQGILRAEEERDRCMKSLQEIGSQQKGEEEEKGIASSVSVNPSVVGHLPPPASLAEVWTRTWNAIEAHFCQVTEKVMRRVRDLNVERVRYFVEERENFARFLCRKDEKQELLDEFVLEFNGSVEMDLRYDGDVKAELHLRTDQLLEKLLGTCDRRELENAEEVSRIRKGGLMEKQLETLLLSYLILLEEEILKFRVSKQLLHDYVSLCVQRQACLPERGIDPDIHGLSSSSLDMPSALSEDAGTLFQRLLREKEVQLLEAAAGAGGTGAAGMAAKKGGGAGGAPRKSKGDLARQDSMRDEKRNSLLPCPLSPSSMVEVFVMACDQLLGRANPGLVPQSGTASQDNKQAKVKKRKTGLDEEGESKKGNSSDPGSPEWHVAREYERLQGRADQIKRKVKATSDSLLADFKREEEKYERAAQKRVEGEKAAVECVSRHIRDAIEGEQKLTQRISIQVLSGLIEEIEGEERISQERLLSSIASGSFDELLQA